MKDLYLALAFVTLGTGLVSAWYWWRSSQVAIDPGEQPEPVEVELKQLFWTAASLRANDQAGRFNKWAAILAGASIATGSMATFISLQGNDVTKVFIITQEHGAMNSSFWGAFSAIVVAILGAILNEMYKRHRDALAAAAALAGELASYHQAFVSLDLSLPVLIGRVEKGEPLNIPEPPPTDIVFEAYVDKLGLLGSKLAEDVALVYGFIRGFRSAFFPLTGTLPSSARNMS